jgi:hypothetical protein
MKFVNDLSTGRGLWISLNILSSLCAILAHPQVERLRQRLVPRFEAGHPHAIPRHVPLRYAARSVARLVTRLRTCVLILWAQGLVYVNFMNVSYVRYMGGCV